MRGTCVRMAPSPDVSNAPSVAMGRYFRRLGGWCGHTKAYPRARWLCVCDSVFRPTLSNQLIKYCTVTNEMILNTQTQLIKRVRECMACILIHCTVQYAQCSVCAMRASGMITSAGFLDWGSREDTPKTVNTMHGQKRTSDYAYSVFLVCW